MKNLKIIILILILILTGVLAVVGLRAAKTFLSGAASGCEPTSVRAQADSGSATVSWQTEKSCQGVVEYGTTPASLLLRALESQQSTTHRLVLSPLKSETTYYFRIRVGEDIYDNNGIPYSFKTMAGEGGGGTAGIEPTPSVASRATVGVPTPTSSVCIKVTVCNKADFTAKFGTSDCRYDFDGNGIVNGADWAKCLSSIR